MPKVIMLNDVIPAEYEMGGDPFWAEHPQYLEGNVYDFDNIFVASAMVTNGDAEYYRDSVVESVASDLSVIPDEDIKRIVDDAQKSIEEGIASPKDIVKHMTDQFAEIFIKQS